MVFLGLKDKTRQDVGLDVKQVLRQFDKSRFFVPEMMMKSMMRQTDQDY